MSNLSDQLYDAQNPDYMNHPTKIVIQNEDQTLTVQNDFFFAINNNSPSQLVTEVNAQARTQNPGYLFYEGRLYAYNVTNEYTNIIDATSDFAGLNNFKFDLIRLAIAILILSYIIGYVLIETVLKPVELNYNKQLHFTSDASHEIKTPINNISSCLELIQQDDDEKDKWLKYSIKETERLKKLTNNLLSLTKSEEKVDIKKLSPINLSDELELITSIFEVKLFEQNFTLNQDIEANNMAKVYQNDFSQLVHILIDNAIKYNNDDKTIDISLKKNVLTIANTSDIKDPNELKHIFDRFYRIDKSRNKSIEGFGLGLAIAKQIIDAYNFKSEVKYDNAKFTFTIKFK